MVKLEKLYYVEDNNCPGEAFRFDNKKRAERYAQAMNEEGADAHVSEHPSDVVNNIIDIF